jgi:hypothetical protein
MPERRKLLAQVIIFVLVMKDRLSNPSDTPMRRETNFRCGLRSTKSTQITNVYTGRRLERAPVLFCKDKSLQVDVEPDDIHPTNQCAMLPEPAGGSRWP